MSSRTSSCSPGEGAFGPPLFGPDSYTHVANCAYAAGIFDGEGHVHVTKYGVGLKVVMMDEHIIDWFMETFTGNKSVQSPTKTQPRLAHQWFIARGDVVVPILQAWRPYLRIKHAEADAAIAFHAWRLSRPKLDPRQHDYAELKAAYQRLHAQVRVARDARHAAYNHLRSETP